MTLLFFYSTLLLLLLSGDHRGSPIQHDHYALQGQTGLSQPPPGLSLETSLGSRLISSMQESSRVFPDLHDVRAVFSDIPDNHARGRRPSRSSVGKRQSRSRRSSSALSDQEQNLEVPMACFMVLIVFTRHSFPASFMINMHGGEIGRGT